MVKHYSTNIFLELLCATKFTMRRLRLPGKEFFPSSFFVRKLSIANFLLCLIFRRRMFFPIFPLNTLQIVIPMFLFNEFYLVGMAGSVSTSLCVNLFSVRLSPSFYLFVVCQILLENGGGGGGGIRERRGHIIQSPTLLFPLEFGKFSISGEGREGGAGRGGTLQALILYR